MKIRLRIFYLPKHWFFSVCWRNSAKNRQKWRCQEKDNFFHFWTKMKQNDNCNFVLPCFCPSNSTGFILFKHYGTYSDQDICLRWGNTPDGGICLMSASQKKLEYFCRFRDKTMIFLLVIVGLSKLQILAEFWMLCNKYICCIFRSLIKRLL